MMTKTPHDRQQRRMNSVKTALALGSVALLLYLGFIVAAVLR